MLDKKLHFCYTRNFRDCLAFLTLLNSLSINDSYALKTAKKRENMKVLNTISTIFISLCLLITVTFAQQTDRILKNKKWKDVPLEVTNLKIKERKINFKEKFKGDDDWFRDLAVEVKNVSDKIIVFIEISLIFPANETVLEGKQSAAQSLASRDRLLYGHYPPLPGENATLHINQPPLKCGDTAVLKLIDYEGTRDFLKKTGKLQSIKEIEVQITEVVFADGIKWNTGELFKRSEDDPTVWLPLLRASILYNRYLQLTPLQFGKASFDLAFSFV